LSKKFKPSQAFASGKISDAPEVPSVNPLTANTTPKELIMASLLLQLFQFL
jgi:hypothetical protein